MNVESAPHLATLQRLQCGEEHALFSVFQLYVYDSSVRDGEELEEDGRFGICPDSVSAYVLDADKAAYWIKVDGALAGFVVTEPVELADGTIVEEFADLFIVKKHRRRGLALDVARQLLIGQDKPWLVAVYRDDFVAAAFWKSAFARLPFRAVRSHADPSLPQFLLYLIDG